MRKHTPGGWPARWPVPTKPPKPKPAPPASDDLDGADLLAALDGNGASP